MRRRLPPTAYRWVARAARHWLALIYRRDLTQLATIFDTDKWGRHWYTPHYERYLAHLRRRPIRLLEIGVGGYEDPRAGGASLRMWKAYFRRGRIVGIDIHDKSALRERRIDIHVCDQTDAQALTQLSKEYGGFDVIVDDGSHLNEHVLQTFNVLFPLLKDGGLYAIEDTQTSYWPSWGGGMDAPGSIMKYFQALTDCLNHDEFPIAEYRPNYFDTHITSIAFFHNLIIIAKGRNEEGSNAPAMIARELQQATK